MLSMVYNNVPHSEACTPAWGMGCVVTGTEKTILFDTGGDGNILLRNMNAMGIHPARIDIVIISHNHGDHTGGLWDFLEQNNSVIVYLPASFPTSFFDRVKAFGASIIPVSDRLEIVPGVYSTGVTGTFTKEQALVIRSTAGLVVVTGCSHPGIDRMVRAAVNLTHERIYLVTGGFHLGSASDTDIEKIIHTLKSLQVEKIAPTHCTGDRAGRLFKKHWGGDFLEAGCGARLILPD